MAWQNAKLHFLLLLNMWICSQGLFAFEVDVNCWWNQALPVDRDVSVLCHTSAQGRAYKCDLCQLHVITSGHQLTSTCANSTETFSFSIPVEHREHINCSCSGSTCNVKAQGGYPPSPPSHPNCVIEDLVKEDIYCSWTISDEPMITTVYTLHWQDYEGNVNSAESDCEMAIINRDKYTKGTQMTVWVTARNVLGYARSEESVFNTGHIRRPDPPYNMTHMFTPLEIFWDMDCDIMGTLDECHVQYHMQNHMLDWTEVDDCQSMFRIEDPQPFTQYSFRVRCHCGHEEKVMSNWSSVYSVRTPPAAPVGQLDVWSDCAPNSDKSSCNVYWKEMPLSQARGEVTSYIVTLTLKNGTEIKQVARQKRDAGNQHRTEHSCPQLRHFPLKPSVVGVFVSASTSMGTSDPTLMPFPEREQSIPEVHLNVRSEKQALLASWSVQPELSERVLQYVVQHVSVAPDRPCLNWLRVDRTQSSVTLTGDFKDYMAYNVSLFAIFNNHSTFLNSSIAYTRQKVPPKVSVIQVTDISHSSVTLTWSPIPVNESNGVILHYLVGINETALMFNVSSARTSILLSDLQPSRQYQAWVSAVSEAGEGPRRFTTFSTSDKTNVVIYVVPTLTVMVVIGLILVFMLLSYCHCFEKIPDPINSKSFKHMNLQYVWPLLRSSSEINLKISELEIMENQHLSVPSPPLETEPENDNQLDRTTEGGEKWLKGPEESNKGNTNPDYSEMVDTDEDEEEGGVFDEEWGNSVSDYERHFMPSIEVI
ncbi:interleukin 12 receptor, beta 2a, like precursor [Danio rerio]|uniref:Interleukin 12 receptor, beta 2a, like precursor n=1 Tax=Danio rerio TaxID=7955 RepID=A0AB13A7Q6_DANRE|nr:interleukin 12 receptor, beta 2a, like precursor [Danio rerio]XP_003198142.2 interleukin-6 receptor subunit beta-like [Danio rerio]|eukprot:XP_003198142.2 interleukin-6 receptor subunit beta-like [Danio rerio]